MDAVVHKTNDFSVLHDIAIRHSRMSANIHRRLYEQWLDSLIRTVKACDEGYNRRTKQVWRDALTPAIDYMISKY